MQLQGEICHKRTMCKACATSPSLVYGILVCVCIYIYIYYVYIIYIVCMHVRVYMYVFPGGIGLYIMHVQYDTVCVCCVRGPQGKA
jgi:hypothetical protein